MTLSRSPSPHPGGGWSSPGLVPASSTASPLPSPGTVSPNAISWATAKAKSDEVRGYPSFSTRNSGFFSRQRHKISNRLPIFRRLSSREYVDKDDYGRDWRPADSGGRGVLSLPGLFPRRGRFKLLPVLFIVWIGYMFCWASKSWLMSLHFENLNLIRSI
jgi:mannan polymerase II complex MNN10 subunit